MRIINKLEKGLITASIDSNTIQNILKPAREILSDHKFWINQEDSLVVFMAEDFFEYYQLPVATEPAVYIDTEFKVAPLAAMMENTPLIKSNIKQKITRLEVAQKIA